MLQAQLTENERVVFERRIRERRSTLVTLAAELGVSKSRVSQIEQEVRVKLGLAQKAPRPQKDFKLERAAEDMVDAFRKLVWDYAPLYHAEPRERVYPLHGRLLPARSS